MRSRKLLQIDEAISAIEEIVLLVRSNIDTARPDSWIDLNLTMSQLKGLFYIYFQFGESFTGSR